MSDKMSVRLPSNNQSLPGSFLLAPEIVQQYMLAREQRLRNANSMMVAVNDLLSFNAATEFLILSGLAFQAQKDRHIVDFKTYDTWVANYNAKNTSLKIVPFKYNDKRINKDYRTESWTSIGTYDLLRKMLFPGDCHLDGTKVIVSKGNQKDPRPEKGLRNLVTNILENVWRGALSGTTEGTIIYGVQVTALERLCQVGLKYISYVILKKPMYTSGDIAKMARVVSKGGDPLLIRLAKHGYLTPEDAAPVLQREVEMMQIVEETRKLGSAVPRITKTCRSQGGGLSSAPPRAPKAPSISTPQDLPHQPIDVDSLFDPMVISDEDGNAIQAHAEQAARLQDARTTVVLINSNVQKENPVISPKVTSVRSFLLVHTLVTLNSLESLFLAHKVNETQASNPSDNMDCSTEERSKGKDAQPVETTANVDTPTVMATPAQPFPVAAAPETETDLGNQVLEPQSPPSVKFLAPPTSTSTQTSSSSKQPPPTALGQSGLHDQTLPRSPSPHLAPPAQESRTEPSAGLVAALAETEPTRVLRSSTKTTTQEGAASVIAAVGTVKSTPKRKRKKMKRANSEKCAPRKDAPPVADAAVVATETVMAPARGKGKAGVRVEENWPKEVLSIERYSRSSSHVAYLAEAWFHILEGVRSLARQENRIPDPDCEKLILLLLHFRATVCATANATFRSGADFEGSIHKLWDEFRGQGFVEDDYIKALFNLYVKDFKLYREELNQQFLAVHNRPIYPYLELEQRDMQEQAGMWNLIVDPASFPGEVTQHCRMDYMAVAQFASHYGPQASLQFIARPLEVTVMDMEVELRALQRRVVVDVFDNGQLGDAQMNHDPCGSRCRLRIGNIDAIARSNWEVTQAPAVFFIEKDVDCVPSQHHRWMSWTCQDQGVPTPQYEFALAFGLIGLASQSCEDHAMCEIQVKKVVSSIEGGFVAIVTLSVKQAWRDHIRQGMIVTWNFRSPTCNNCVVHGHGLGGLTIEDLQRQGGEWWKDFRDKEERREEEETDEEDEESGDSSSNKSTDETSTDSSDYPSSSE
ncbi:hypothetical protein HDU93_009905 [Gonapodya sp. JEL0774]|nr:hypothetical protein HDU93_009905 [Gonapodya sp. JEL0774]